MARPKTPDHAERFFLKTFMTCKGPHPIGKDEYHCTGTCDEAREILRQCLDRGMAKLSVGLVGWELAEVCMENRMMHKTKTRVRRTVIRRAVMGFWLASAGWLLAGERPPPHPSQTRIPVVQDAEAAQAALEQSRVAGQALLADLTLGQEGKLIQAVAAQPLKPGLYRLHALVASIPHDHILVDAVALKLTAGASNATFERRERFPDAGELADVFLDFAVAAEGDVTIGAEWFVGDSQLDRERFRDRNEARRVYRAQRQNAINQHILQKRPGGDGDLIADGGTEELGLDDLLEDETQRYTMRSISGRNVPAYRLLLTGLVIETLSPVEILDLHTCKPAYEGDGKIRVSAQLHNLADQPVSLRLRWSMVDDDEPGKTLADAAETVELQAGQTRTHTLENAFSAVAIGLVGRINLTASVPGRRARSANTPFVMLPPVRKAVAHEKRIFAHYMACWPIGYGALPWEQRNEGVHLKHESKDVKIRRGGHVRNYALRPQNLKLTPEESADLEIQRAMRIGIDGFAIDAWAGGEGAMKTFDALIRTAQARNYPFEVTICIDPACGGRIDDTVKWLLENYGDNPKLARRNGKPLIFGYFSQGPAWAYANRKMGARTDAEKKAVRASELGWHLAGAAFREAERHVGSPVFYQFDYGYLFHPYSDIPEEKMVDALGVIARYVDAVGAFSFAGRYGDRIADAVKASGAEWSDAIGMYQKENIPFEVYSPLGTEWLEGKWHDLRTRDATLPQLVTWNDYGENTNIAPAWETRYTLYDLTAYHIQWWKTGKQPPADHDRLYLIYAKYPRDAKVWPFAQGVARPRKLEVVTILPEPATIRLPGREIEFEAPAGYARKQFPLTVGPVIAEIVREGQVVTRLESPEPITDRPFRESNGLICYSTEFMRYWQADFGDAQPFLYGEYADDDEDGLPNWYEMYWFTAERNFKPVASNDGEALLDGQAEHPVTRWLDFSTMTQVNPDDDPDGDGKSNLEEYLERTDPTIPAPPETNAGPDMGP